MTQIAKFKNLAKIIGKLSTKPLIVSAGMRRSGSTLLFNILREILVAKWKNRLSSGWEGDFMALSKGATFLIKTHKVSPFYRWRAQHIFYTYRDVRVAAVSRLRKFNRQITMESIRSEIRQYEIAKKACSLVVKYEDLIETPSLFIQQLASILCINVDSDDIYQKTFELKPPDVGSRYSKETLLHKGHFTHTKDGEWREIIPHELQTRINEEFSWWFSECGYPPK